MVCSALIQGQQIDQPQIDVIIQSTPALIYTRAIRERVVTAQPSFTRRVVMALLKRNTTMWLLRTFGALTIAFAASAGITGQAFAHDSNDDNEVVTYGPNACTIVTDLPVPVSATCVKHKNELDDGVTETKNSYTTPESANAVRLAFEQALSQHGWTVVKAKQDVIDQEWDYMAIKGLRRVKVEVDAQEPDEGTGTEFSIEEN
jgi:hypothetical protein